MRPTHRYLAATLVTLTLAACSDSTAPSLGPPAKLLIQAGGTPQTAVFGQTVPTAPTVLVTDANNQPLPGVAVTFAITSGGGSLSSTTQTTNSSGIASVVWTVGNPFGANTLIAVVAGLPPVTFSATAILSDAVVLAFDLVDPAGDTLNTFAETTPTPTAIDLVSLRGDYKRDTLILTATFSGPIPNLIRGYVEFNIDDEASTGDPYVPLSDLYGASAAVGIDYRLHLYGLDASIDHLSMHGDTLFVTGSPSVQVNYGGNTVVVRVPMGLLGNDDGNFSIVGVLGTMDRATDVFPNSGQTTVRFPSPWDYQTRLR
jgi:hypothetical protein